MPINLDFQAAPVSRFAKESPEKAAQGTLQIGSALSNAISSTGREWARLRDERELSNTATKLQEKQSMDEEERQVRFYHGGDELEGTEFKGEKYERSPNGVEIPKQIPSWQATPYIRKRDSLDNLKNAAAGITNKRLRESFLDKGKQKIEQTFQADIAASIDEAKAHMRFETATQVEELKRLGKHEDAIEVIEYSSLFSVDEKTEARKNIKNDSEIFDVQNIIVEPNWGQEEFKRAEDQIEYLGDKNYKGSLDQETRIKLIASLRTKMRSEAASGSAKATAAQVRYEVDLDRRIQNPPIENVATVTEATLWDDHQKGYLTTQQYKSLALKVNDRDTKYLEKIERLSNFSASLLSGTKPAPTAENKNTNSELYDLQIDEYIKSVGGAENVDPKEILEIGLTNARVSSMMPSAIKEEFLAGEGGDPEQLKASALLYNQYKETAPAAVNNMNLDAPTLLSVAARLNYGIKPSAAVDGAVKVRDMSPQQKEVFKSTWRGYAKGENGQPIGAAALESLQTFLDSDSQFKVPNWMPFLGGAPVAPSEFGAPSVSGIPADAAIMYQHLVKVRFEQEGLMGVAQQMAQDDFKKIYSVTNINDPDSSKWWADKSGNQLMAYAPPTDQITTKYVRNDIEEKFKDVLQEGYRLYVYSDAETLAQGPKDPIQKVVGIGPNGEEDVLGIWQFDIQAVENSRQKYDINENIKNTKARIRRLQKASTYGNVVDEGMAKENALLKAYEERLKTYE